MIRIIGIIISALIYAFNMKAFVHVADLVPGGLSGVAVLIQRCVDRFVQVSIPISPIYYALNIFPIYIGFRYIGKNFTLFTMLHIVLFGVFTDMIPPIPITYDMFLVSLFGGILSGVAGSIVLMTGASGGGTDFISVYLNQKRGIDSFNIILGFNVLVLLIAGLIFGWEKALYSIIYQYVTTQVIHVFYKNYQQNTIMIVTDYPEEVCMTIDEVTHHGATIMEAQGARELSRKWIVYSVVSAHEVRGLARDIRIVDPKAFVNVMKTEYIGGLFYRERQD